MIKICRKEKCIGCGSCELSCPQKCIRLKADDEGFLYPVVNKVKCVNCGICEKVCPIITSVPPSGEVNEAYAGKNTCDKIRMSCSGSVK